jgi:hypothetical protein
MHLTRNSPHSHNWIKVFSQLQKTQRWASRLQSAYVRDLRGVIEREDA